MKIKTKILIVEHDPADLELINHELEVGGIHYVSEIVENERDYIKALKIFLPDIILSDYSLPAFSGLAAFKVKEEMAPNTPFIIVSGAIGEEKSVDLIKTGITDYALKGKLFTLTAKVKRALKESIERQLRNNTEQELVLSEKKYRQIVETAQEGIWLIDENNNTTLVNKKMADILEYSPGEMIGKKDYCFMDEEWKKKASEQTENRKLGIQQNHEFKYITKRGKEVWTSLSTNPVFDDAGVYKGSLAMVMDITERKVAAGKIKDSEQRYRALFEQNLTGICQSGIDGVILNCNEAFAKMLKYDSPEELLTVNAFDLYFTRAERQNFIKALRDKKKLSNYEVVLKCKDGSRLDVIENNSLRKDELTGKEICEGILIDITDSKRTGQEIGWMINNTEESFILLNMKLEITSFNKKAQELYSKYLGKSLLKGVYILDYAQPARINIVKAIYEKVLKGFEETDEIVIKLRGNHVKNFSLKYKPAKDEYGQIIGAFVSAIDTTEKKRAERQKEFESRDKEALINTTTDLIWSVSSDFKLIAANKAFINSIIGFNGVYLQPGDELLMKDKFPAEYLGYWQALYAKALTGNSYIEEIHLPGSDSQSESWVEINFNPIYDTDIVTGVACYSRNITASKNFKNRLVDINKKLKTAQQIARLGYWELDMDINTLFWSDEVYNIWEVSPDTYEINFKNYYRTIHPADRKIFDDAQKNALEGKEAIDIEHRIILASGKIKYVHEKGELVYNTEGKAVRLEGTVQDITERKELETLLNRANKMARIGSWEVNLVKNTLYWSDITKEIHETEPGFVPDLQKAIDFYKEGKNRELIIQKVEEAVNKGLPWDQEFQIISAKGNEKWIRTLGQTEFVNEECVRVYGSFQDIDAQKRNELKVNEVLEEKNIILESIDDAFFAVDKHWTITYWNNQAEKVFGKLKNETLDHNLWEVFSDRIDSPSFNKFHHAIEAGQSVHFEDYYPALSAWYEISAYPSGTGLSIYFKDVSERKLYEIHLNNLNEDLQNKAKELATSNAELEQFAYVASHDLQEPLRMITSFLGQLEKKYGGIIDVKGKKYIDFALDGAKRMRQIILDLLEYSRVGVTEDGLENIDINKLLTEIEFLLRKQITEKKATLIYGTLPIVHAHKSPMRQVFQNLVGNALKYTKENIPAKIQIDALESETHWQFSVSDNGIGIEKEYFDKIFIIFQRLHNKDEFSGTGMGLAITKKIVETLGGRVWVESEEGKGSTFYFTILKRI